MIQNRSLLPRADNGFRIVVPDPDEKVAQALKDASVL